MGMTVDARRLEVEAYSSVENRAPADTRYRARRDFPGPASCAAHGVRDYFTLVFFATRVGVCC